MPYPNEHACRVKDPGDFQKPMKSKKLPGSDVRMIIGRLKGETTTTVQAYRFPKDKYTVAEAKKWLKDNDVKCTSFEAATGEERGLMQRLFSRIRDLFEDVDECSTCTCDDEDIERAISTQRLFDQFYAYLRGLGQEWMRVLDIYHDDGEMYGLVVLEGKLFRYPLTVVNDALQVGAAQQVMEIHEPVTAARSSISIYRQADGRIRLTTIAATAVLNRVGEIDSTELFDNMIRRAQESGEYPYVTFWHCGEALRMGQADFLARDEAVYIASALLDEGNDLAEALARDAEANPTYWGTSIKYLPAGEPDMVEIIKDVRIPVYRDGKHIEISILPENRAASWFTAISTTEVSREMNAEIVEHLKKLLEDKADEWIGRVDDINRQITEDGMITRTDTAPAADLQPAPETQPATTVEMDEEAMTALVMSLVGTAEFKALVEGTAKLRADVDGLVRQVGESGTTLAGEITKVCDRLAVLERSEEEKQREWLADLPPQRRLNVTYRPRVANAPQQRDGQPQQAEDPAAIALAKIKAAKGKLA